MTAPASGQAVSDGFEAACLAELDALKPGNVHRHAPGHGMSSLDFERSAAAAAPSMGDPGLSVGERILSAVEATRAAVGCNTNLGIVLLCAPLAQAALRRTPEQGLRDALADVLRMLDVADASLAFRAIRLAAPGGLGSSPRHDVRGEPSVTLLEAMGEAASRDRIARQYVTGFADVFRLGVTRLESLRADGWPEGWAVTGTYLGFLASFRDSHILRKFGPVQAKSVQQEACALDRRVRAGESPASLLGDLLAFDGALKSRNLNPGTSADLTVASHFAAALAGARP
jgi:triphosphoribosyl-dephospho-CoA synthase